MTRRVFRILLIAALLASAAGRGAGRRTSPAMDAYLSWLFRNAPALYRAYAAADAAKTLCGARTEWRPAENASLSERRPDQVFSAAFPAARAGLPVLFPSRIVLSHRPLPPGWSAPVPTRPPR
jgi:hypothetical protein